MEEIKQTSTQTTTTVRRWWWSVGGARRRRTRRRCFTFFFLPLPLPPCSRFRIPPSPYSTGNKWNNIKVEGDKKSFDFDNKKVTTGGGEPREGAARATRSRASGAGARSRGPLADSARSLTFLPPSHNSPASLETPPPAHSQRTDRRQQGPARQPDHRQPRGARSGRRRPRLRLVEQAAVLQAHEFLDGRLDGSVWMPLEQRVSLFAAREMEKGNEKWR